MARLRIQTPRAIVFITILIVTVIASAMALLFLSRRSEKALSKPTRAISVTCDKARFRSLCMDSLLAFPGSSEATEAELVHLSTNASLVKARKAFFRAHLISDLEMDTRVRSAYEDCLELLDDSVDAISRALLAMVSVRQGEDTNVHSNEDVLTWLSAALTNQDTCKEGFDDVSGNVKAHMTRNLQDLPELVSNALSIFSSRTLYTDFAGAPIQNKRKLMSSAGFEPNKGLLPSWVSREDRRLLESPLSAIQADVVVSGDGNGTCRTISRAIKMAPEFGNRRFIIYVRAGRYEERNLKVGRKKTNLMFIGDGQGSTIIFGSRSIFDNITTFHTATFATTGAGFIARDLTFMNLAGPAKHQAVALRVSSDHAVIYRCTIFGYQDTLYVHAKRQFYRECNIFGTIDFIFGNAAVVFQNCSIYALRPMPSQKNTITAQNRKDPSQNTGISIHDCRVLATPDLEVAKHNFSTYLGRPWKPYSRVVYMLSYMGDHIDPSGWLEWNGTYGLDTLYYGEYMNYGPGSQGVRVNWTGYHPNMSLEEANKFTVAQFIYGSSWLPYTGVAFLAGLSD